MKNFLLTGLILATGLSTQATEINYFGQFSMAHKTAVYGYDTKKACEKDDGEWLTEDEICVFDASDDLTVTPSNQGANLIINTIGGNAHMCSFEGAATVKSANELISQVETEVYEYNSETKQGEFVKAICEVTVTYKDSDTASVSNNGKCQEFCGARAHLYIEDAKREAPKAD